MGIRYTVNEPKFCKVSRALGIEPRPEFMLNLAVDCENHECKIDNVRAVSKFHPIHGLISTT